MFIAYSDTSLGGPRGALHEVPFGQLIGTESFKTLDSWYTIEQKKIEKWKQCIYIVRYPIKYLSI